MSQTRGSKWRLFYVHWKFQIAWLRCSLFFVFARRAFSWWLSRKKKFSYFPCCFGFSISFSLPQSPNYSLYMCVSSLLPSPFYLPPPPPTPCCILSGFPLPFVFCFSPTSEPTDPYVLVLISFPDWTHFLSWPYFSWPSPSFLYTCPEPFSCQTQNCTMKVPWKGQTLEDAENGCVVCCVALLLYRPSWSKYGCQWRPYKILSSMHPQNISEDKKTDAKFQ